ncbi:uncharacterized protein [Lolium perenne]|nr:uncharacterized protein LOC127316641 isoform X2 [Lolium perenne]
MMGQEKRKTSSAEEETENLLKSLHLDAAAASEMLWEFSHPPLTEEVESTTGDSTYDIGSCEHLFIDSEELDEIARGLKAAHKPPTCVHDPCSGAAGIMACTECPSTFCTGEKGDRENPQGHAAWHASNDQHWVALWCDEPSKGYCFECGLTLVLGQNKVNEDDYALVPRNKKDERGTVSSYVEALPELSHPPSPEDGESTTGDSTYDIGSCQHLFSDSEQLDKMARHFKAAHKPPTCEHDPCSGAAGMMACTECPYTFCTGEKGDRENPQGHARWHASTFQHWGCSVVR